MANEAVCIEAPTEFRRVTVADGGAIPLYSLMQLSGDNTATISNGANVFAGIAWEEKTASDGITELTLAIDGVWDMKDAGASITLGGIASLNGVNLIKQATEAEMVTGAIVGKVFETAAASEVVRVHVGRFA